MAQNHGPVPLDQIAAALGATIVGAAEGLISRPVPAGVPDPEGITFASSPKHLALALGGPIGAILTPRGTGPQTAVTLEVDDPRASFMGVLMMFDSRPKGVPGIHPTAVVHPTARVSASASLGAYVVVEEEAEVGDEVHIHPHCVVGARTKVGEGSLLFPNVTLYHDVLVGSRCILHSGAVIGADGFGFAFAGGRQIKIPQVGRVVIGDDVEIGANSCVDRATCGDTLIASGVKLDNLVMVGHNTKVGSHTVMASQTGISGSVTIGERCVFGGQAGVGDHAVLEDDVILGGQTGVTGKVASGTYLGSPGIPISTAMRAVATYRRLPEMMETLRRLERELEALRSGPDHK
jgi:UDP-3-O-[3-hydroxymyristoyl] glucosamine N-acyltransferase